MQIQRLTVKVAAVYVSLQEMEYLLHPLSKLSDKEFDDDWELFPELAS